MRLKMKINTNRRVALITGANRGIGLQTAKDLGPDGVFLLLGVRNLAKGQAAAESMRNDGFEVEAVHLDVTDPSTHGEVYDFIDRIFGRLDILVSNAGICLENPNARCSTQAGSPRGRLLYGSSCRKCRLPPAAIHLGNWTPNTVGLRRSLMDMPTGS
jgi:NAD(P)-dependent dehydrogenase (short-subunit alcohol dehydrogenase family)